jgi:hypothetical protein
MFSCPKINITVDTGFGVCVITYSLSIVYIIFMIPNGIMKKTKSAETEQVRP